MSKLCDLTDVGLDWPCSLKNNFVLPLVLVELQQGQMGCGLSSPCAKQMKSIDKLGLLRERKCVPFGSAHLSPQNQLWVAPTLPSSKISSWEHRTHFFAFFMCRGINIYKENTYMIAQYFSILKVTFLLESNWFVFSTSKWSINFWTLHHVGKCG